MAHGLRLQRVIDLMQEPALVLVPVAQDGESAVVDYRAEMCNESAAAALGIASASLVGRTLVQLLPEDTAVLLRRMCAQALAAGEPVEHAAAAPDPLTDLGRTYSVSVQVTGVGAKVLCTWLPGWLTANGDDRVSPDSADGARVSAGDQLELASAVDEVADAGIGVFSLDLMSGRMVGSRGLHRIFGSSSKGEALADVQSGLESAVAEAGAWQALLRRGEPMDVEVRLSPELGGHRMRVVGRVSYGADGHPAVVRGACSVL